MMLAALMLWRSGGDVDVSMSTLAATATAAAMVTVMVTSDGKLLNEEHIKNGEEHLLLQGEGWLPIWEDLRMV